MKVIFLIGTSGAGKSFFSAWLKRHWPCEVVSSDGVRERVWGKRFDSAIKASVLKEMLEKCRTLVLEGRNVVLDTTYFNLALNRQLLYDYMAECEVEYIAIEFSVGLDICIARDSLRIEGRKVGVDVIERQADELEYPAKDECKRLEAWDVAALCDALCIEPQHRLEILAPAGRWKQLVEAVKAGCDAVYGGLEKWNARGRAKNFTLEEYIAALRFCHESGVKFYLTLNTLVCDDEITAIVTLFSSGEVALPDAFIVADVGLMVSLRTTFPSVPLHVSTQGGVATTEDALFYRKMGASRLILARELNFVEIENICRVSGLEIEVFAYGSQCVAFSGQCMWGALLHGCSGNRGRCIGMCRDTYESGGRVGSYLYPRDLSAFGSIGKLAACGVCSIKIEGRMRPPEEIADVVTAFRKNGDPRLAARFGGNYEGFLSGEHPNHMFSTENPRKQRSVKSCFTLPFSTCHPNVSLRAMCDTKGRLVGFDYIDDRGGRNAIGVTLDGCCEKMSVSELSDLVRRSVSANVYEFTSDRKADERIEVPVMAMRKALEMVGAVCGVQSALRTERVDFSPKSSLCAVSSLQQLDLARSFGFCEFILPWQGEDTMEQVLGIIGEFSVVWELPIVDFKHSLSAITSVLNKHRQGVVVPRLSQLEALHRGFAGEVILGAGGNVWNVKTMEVLKAHNVSSAFLSPERPISGCASELVAMGVRPIVNYWGYLPMAVSRGCFKSVVICNGECSGWTGRLRNVGKGYDVDLFCDGFSDTRVFVPEKTFFSGNEIGPARKCVSFRWMNDSTVKRYLLLYAEEGLEEVRNIYCNEGSKR